MGLVGSVDEKLQKTLPWSMGCLGMGPLRPTYYGHSLNLLAVTFSKEIVPVQILLLELNEDDKSLNQSFINCQYFNLVNSLVLQLHFDLNVSM